MVELIVLLFLATNTNKNEITCIILHLGDWVHFLPFMSNSFLPPAEGIYVKVITLRILESCVAQL